MKTTNRIAEHLAERMPDFQTSECCTGCGCDRLAERGVYYFDRAQVCRDCWEELTIGAQLHHDFIADYERHASHGWQYLIMAGVGAAVAASFLIWMV